jgi:hypothetical protein
LPWLAITTTTTQYILALIAINILMLRIATASKLEPSEFLQGSLGGSGFLPVVARVGQAVFAWSQLEHPIPIRSFPTNITDLLLISLELAIIIRLTLGLKTTYERTIDF